MSYRAVAVVMAVVKRVMRSEEFEREEGGD
jgi:hypothetical protein